MDRLFPGPGAYDRLPSNMCQATPFDPESLGGYERRLLGLTLDEAVSHLYARHVKTTCAARRLTFQIVNTRFNTMPPVL
jgi:hypothetical protein